MSTAEPVPTRVSLDEFHEFERTHADRHELIDGQIVLMKSGTDRNNTIEADVYSLIRDPARAQGCRPYVEVLSASTAMRDHGPKLRSYTQIPELLTYWSSRTSGGSRCTGASIPASGCTPPMRRETSSTCRARE